MLVLEWSIYRNTRILDATNYANQDYMRVNYTLIVVYSMHLVTGKPIKKRLKFWPGYACNGDR
jgi:hypothetical protein